MNENQIEILLRRAPAPPAPAGLLARLCADIHLPCLPTNAATHGPGVPRWQRWLPALAFGLLFLGCLIVLGIQTSQLQNLRQQNETLRPAAPKLDELRRENDRLRQLSASADRVKSAPRDGEELSTLREEAGRLRSLTQELSPLRAENARLQAAHTTNGRTGVAPEEDPFAALTSRADSLRCLNNMKQLGLAARMWSNDNKQNATTLPLDFLTMRNELATPRILSCPSDTGRVAPATWEQFDGSSVTYELPSRSPDERDPSIIYSRCPIHGHLGLCDGSVLQGASPPLEMVLENGNLKLRQNARATKQ